MAGEPPDTSLPGILRVPPRIRRRIYLHLGLGARRSHGRRKTAVYNLGYRYEHSSWETEDERRPRSFYGLLVSCQTVYAEASTLLYSSNWFVFHYRPSQSFAPLRALTPGTISSLSNLRVVLNQCSCHCENPNALSEGYRHCCDTESFVDRYYQNRHERRYCDTFHRTKDDLPVQALEPQAKAMLADWQETVAYLADYIRPGQLELSVVCDVHDEDLEFAKLVMDALGPFPRLKDCHVRLSRNPVTAIQEIAHDAVLRARGIVPAGSRSAPTPSVLGFRLLSLPTELRLRILEHTDLITPANEVMWTRAHGKYLATLPYRPSRPSDKIQPPRIHHSFQFSTCSRRTYPTQSIGCFCRITHAAFSSTCRCWAPPTPLFLVCRTLRDDANLIFFSMNHFVIIDGPSLSVFGPPRNGGYEHNLLAASRFLRNAVPAGCHGHLRVLELIFPPTYGGSWPREEHHLTWKDWSDTIDWVRDKINAPALSIRVLATYKEDDFFNDGTEKLTDSDAKQIIDAYFRILEPLARLGGSSNLAGFHADLTWPWRRSPSVIQDRYENQEKIDAWLEAAEHSLREQAERFVLGDRYDLLCSGGTEPERGAWQWLFELCT